MSAVVTALAVTPVKGTRVRPVDRIALDRAGARGNRRFYLIDERGRMLNGKQLGGLNRVLSDYSAEEAWLRMVLPGNELVEGPVELDGPVRARFYSRSVQARLVRGPWSSALSEHLGAPLRLVQGDSAVDRGARGAASLISRASLAALASAADVDTVDPRRFRMLIEIDGVGAHEEDGWVGSSLRVGEAVVRWGGHVGRCLVTSRDPETGEIDLPTLEVLRGYRDGLDTTEPLAFGVYGEVLRPGAVRVGDSVVPDSG